jgi:hypothetical protein
MLHWLLLRELVAHLIRELTWLLRWNLASRWEIVLLLNSRGYVLKDVSRDALWHTLLLQISLLSNCFSRDYTKATSASGFTTAQTL